MPRSDTVTPRARTLAAAIREVRTDAGGGLRELARRIGIHFQLLSQWEYGLRNPRLEDVTAILGALGVVGCPEAADSRSRERRIGTGLDHLRLFRVPARCGWHPGIAGPVVLYSLMDKSSVVSFEHLASGAFVPDDHDVRKYRAAVKGIQEVAMSPAESASFIARLAEETDGAEDWVVADKQP